MLITLNSPEQLFALLPFHFFSFPVKPRLLDKLSRLTDINALENKRDGGGRGGKVVSIR